MFFGNIEALIVVRDRHDRIVGGFNTTCAIIAYHHYSNAAHGEMYSIQRYVIKFVSDFR